MKAQHSDSPLRGEDAAEPCNGGDAVAPVDLTMTMRLGMRGVDWEQAKTVEKEGWNARTLHLYSHAGTHMDAQTHFAAGLGTIDVTPLERCMGPAWVVNLESLADKALITVADLGDVATKFQSGDSLLLSTRWSRHVDDPQHYRDNFPRISEELARWCVAHGVNVLGVEPPSVADVNNMEELTLIHKILLGANITIVEGLTNLDQLTEKVFFVAAPLKIEGGDGCPCRAFAWNNGVLAVSGKSSVPAASSRQTDGEDAVVPCDGGDASIPRIFLDHSQVTAHRTNLPHWQQDHATYFLTFRLADSLPQSLLAPWRTQRAQWQEAHPEPWSEEDEAEYHKLFSSKVDQWLDQGHGSCQLRQPACRDLVSKALQHYHGERYDLWSFVVMPNHVHVLFSLRSGHHLVDVVQNWKSFTAHAINKLTNRKGELWMRDYFDRSIRDQGHFHRVFGYIQRNPEKANLRSGEYEQWNNGVLAVSGKSGVPAASPKPANGGDAVAPCHGEDAVIP